MFILSYIAALSFDEIDSCSPVNDTSFTVNDFSAYCVCTDLASDFGIVEYRDTI